MPGHPRQPSMDGYSMTIDIIMYIYICGIASVFMVGICECILYRYFYVYM